MAWRSRRLACVEGLEPRSLFNSVTINGEFPRDLISDESRSVFYAIDGYVATYDLVTGQRKLGIDLGDDASPGGGDITVDGSALYVSDGRSTSTQGVVHRINLADNTVTDLPFEVSSASSYGHAQLVVVSPQTAIFTDPSGNLRKLDLATGNASIVLDSVTGRPITAYKLIRSADRQTVVFTDSLGNYGVYHTATDTFSTSLIKSYWAANVAVSSDGSRVAIDTSTSSTNFGPAPVITDGQLSIVREFPPDEDTVAFDPVRPIIYTYNRTSDRISAFDVNSWEKLYDFAADSSVVLGNFTFRETLVTEDGKHMVVGWESQNSYNTRAIRIYSLAETKPVITGITGSVQRDKPVPITVTMTDARGGVVTDFVGSVRFESSAYGAVLPEPIVFKAADHGVKTASVLFPVAVADFSLTAIAVDGGGSFVINHIFQDTVAPTTSFSTISTYEGSPSTLVTVYYTDDSRLDTSTIGAVDDIVVRDRKGRELAVKMDPFTTPYFDYGGKTGRATYLVLPPGGAWDEADSGDYTIAGREGAVTDMAGNSVDMTPKTFTVDIAPPPPPPPDGVVSLAVMGLKDNRAAIGSAITARVTIRNVGEGALATANVYADLKGNFYGYSTYEGFDERRVNIKPGKSKTFNFKLFISEFADPGDYTVTASAYPDGGSDMNEADNEVVSDSFEIYDPVGPLTALPLTLMLMPSSSAQAKVTVQNDSTNPVRGQYTFQLLVTADGTVAGRTTTLATLTKLISLKPGQQKAIPCRFETPAGLAEGNYQLLLVDSKTLESVVPPIGNGGGSGAGVIFR